MNDCGVLDDTNAILPDFPLTRFHFKLTKYCSYTFRGRICTQNTANGQGYCSEWILRELAREISVPYCNLFNQSLRTGIAPSQYKEANVCPIPKKGFKLRPISLLNSEDKLFERLVFKYLFKHLPDNNVLSSLQSGVIPGHSSIYQLTFLYTTLCKAVD